MTETQAPLRFAAELQNRIVIIGAGLDGLIAAYYLAKAGLAPLVLEQREVIGGACATEEFHPGFRASLATTAGALLPQIAAELQLQTAGIRIEQGPVRVTALNLNGPPLSIYDDTDRTARELKLHSQKDSDAYPAFAACFANIGRALRPLLTMTPPDVDGPSTSELWSLATLGWKIRGLGKKDEYRLLRYGPMAVADLAAEWFDHDLLRAVVAARGIFGAFAGPWSAGTSLPLLLQAATDGHAVASASFVRGGTGNLIQAIAQAATTAGAEIQTAARIDHIGVEQGRVASLTLQSGEIITTKAIVSNCDPSHTLLKLVEPGELAPSFRTKAQNFRAHGTVARIDLALSSLPSFVNVDGSERLSGQIHLGPGIDYLERAFDAAKYGEISSQPYLQLTIPTLNDATRAPQGAHVMSIQAQFAPYKLKNGDWQARREELGDTVVDALSEYAPDLKRLIIARRVITPLDLETSYGFRGGHIHHGEMSLDQFFAFRPVIGCAQYRTPIEGLYLCGAGTHPGSGLTGASGLNASREVIRDLVK
ncbi:MAG TPA: NAD(P)/FAD-dependent oxidoreductase [Pyrinomonadaceae bacterium]|nr:NAD(P)/FAD-dependent oxidoreductase [Pyrinomonadaceae bacterium]